MASGGHRIIIAGSATQHTPDRGQDPAAAAGNESRERFQ